jgi:hypothetical protein
MISRKDMMGIIATESIEGPSPMRRTMRQGASGPEYGYVEVSKKKRNEPSMICDLRLVREPDGSLHWED